VQVNR